MRHAIDAKVNKWWNNGIRAWFVALAIVSAICDILCRPSIPAWQGPCSSRCGELPQPKSDDSFHEISSRQHYYSCLCVFKSSMPYSRKLHLSTLRTLSLIWTKTVPADWKAIKTIPELLSNFLTGVSRNERTGRIHQIPRFSVFSVMNINRSFHSAIFSSFWIFGKIHRTKADSSDLFRLIGDLTWYVFDITGHKWMALYRKSRAAKAGIELDPGSSFPRTVVDSIQYRRFWNSKNGDRS
jgi:hypothetical protein